MLFLFSCCSSVINTSLSPPPPHCFRLLFRRLLLDMKILPFACRRVLVFSVCVREGGCLVVSWSIWLLRSKSGCLACASTRWGLQYKPTMASFLVCVVPLPVQSLTEQIPVLQEGLLSPKRSPQDHRDRSSRLQSQHP